MVAAAAAAKAEEPRVAMEQRGGEEAMGINTRASGAAAGWGAEAATGAVEGSAAGLAEEVEVREMAEAAREATEAGAEARGRR